MSLAKRLDALRERAQRDLSAIDDDVLLSTRHGVLPEEIAERHYLTPVRLGRASFDSLRAIKMAVAGAVGDETPVVVPGTRVSLWVDIDGGETLAFIHEEDDELEQASIEIDLKEHRLDVGYIAEHPTAHRANQFFEHSVSTIEAEVERVNQIVREFNDSLVPAIATALEEAKELAAERKKLAEGLKPPASYERWWGRP